MNFNFRNPTHHLIDKDPQFLDELKECKDQREARHLRNLYIKRLEREFKRRIEGSNKPPVEKIKLFPS